MLEYETLEWLTTPEDGRIVLMDRWWVHLPGHGFAFYKRSPKDRWRSPQCNTNRGLVERLIRDLHGGDHEAIHVRLAFLPHNCGDAA